MTPQIRAPREYTKLCEEADAAWHAYRAATDRCVPLEQQDVEASIRDDARRECNAAFLRWGAAVKKAEARLAWHCFLFIDTL